MAHHSLINGVNIFRHHQHSSFQPLRPQRMHQLRHSEVPPPKDEESRHLHLHERREEERRGEERRGEERRGEERRGEERRGEERRREDKRRQEKRRREEKRKQRSLDA
ncbi:unnamed protein product [Closterium sp. NIES-54]